MRKVAVAVAVLALACPTWAEVKDPKPGFNLFSRDQDVQIGREGAAEVEKQFKIVDDAQLSSYIKNLGEQLVKSKRAGQFPYSFKVVVDESINAFALPGGPMYIHTGLITAADNEAQLAGVMAHEISHVALRHGTNQASKQNLIALPAALAANSGGGGMLGSLTKLGLGIGANSVLMRFSRGAESQADYNGALILSDAGYNPIEMARFFEKLEGERGRRSGIERFFSSHPNPGNRMAALMQLSRELPRKNYVTTGVDFKRIQAIVAKIPVPAKPKPQQQAAPAR
jgi:beta-barrel assembly-enhancing protease